MWRSRFPAFSARWHRQVTHARSFDNIGGTRGRWDCPLYPRPPYAQADPASRRRQHIICEKETLSPFTTEAEYFDDEELDRYRGVMPDDYSPEATEEFRQILMTMRPEEVPAWVRSLAVREVEIPAGLRDEVLLIVSELRNK